MEIRTDAYEKLGAFYLGRSYDLEERSMLDDLVLYDSKDLTTHAVCVGMTGSGKTGLCISILEEAIIDNIPAIVIDPKGDISNLLLTFPSLKADDFRPWINEDEARTKGVTPDDFAEGQADLWKKGLASWGQGSERLKKLKDASDITIYTPGSQAGVGVSILDSFSPPPQEVIDDGDSYREQIKTTASSILGLLGIDADPIKSREHILISSLFDHAWQQGTEVSLASLIQGIQNPPFDKIGVMGLDSFFPEKDRFELSIQLNNILASPGFESWLEGAPLQIDQMLYGEKGRPRVAIFSIAHLSDAERMFFVSLLLNQVLGWMRTKPGTNSLRALLYIDELFGYMPPVANPPSKQPLLTMLKQARAFGVGLILATQNPVDLDYKGLSNAGTWFIGRLQTERDKARMLDGLEGISAGNSLSRKELEQTISGLGKRVFLLHNVHESGPVIFHTRWAMSYLRGPITRNQIKELMAGKRDASPTRDNKAQSEQTASTGTATRPVLPPSIPEFFLAARGSDEVTYRPYMMGLAEVHFVDTRKGLESSEEKTWITPIADDVVQVDWETATELDVHSADLETEPITSGTFENLPGIVSKKTTQTKWRKDLENHLYRSRRHHVFKYPPLKLFSEPGESERDFRIRLLDATKEDRDEKVQALKDKYEKRLRSAEEKIRKAEQKIEREKDQADASRMQSVVNVGTTILGSLLGRKKLSRTSITRASSAVRGMSRSAKEKQDVERAIEDFEAASDRYDELQQEMEDAVDELTASLDPQLTELESVEIKPRKTDIDVKIFGLLWLPHSGSEPAY